MALKTIYTDSSVRHSFFWPFSNEQYVNLKQAAQMEEPTQPQLALALVTTH